jgi:multiple sugar transport system substrate-binding protein
MKKAFLIIAVALIFVGAAAFGQGKTVELRYALWDGNQKPAMEAAIAAFQKQNPQIKVSVELTEWNDYWNRITTGVAAGTTPDVFWGHVAYFASLADKGALGDLAPFISKDKFDTTIYYPGLLDNWKYGGKQYGLAKDWDTICYAYNKDMAAKAGVDPTTWSWNPSDGGSFIQGLQKLTIDKNGKNASQAGFDPNNVVQYAIGGITAGEIQTGWLPFVWGNGGTGSGVLDKPFGSKFALDDPKTVAALQFFSDLVNKYHVAPSSSSQGFAGNGQDLFVAQRVAMYPAGPWTLGSTRANATFAWDVAPLPNGPAGRVSPFNGLAHLMYAKTKYPNEAWKLIKFLDGPEGQKIISSFAVVFPAVKAALPTYMKAFEGKAPANIHFYFDTAAAKTGPYPQHLKWAQIWDIVNRELDGMMSGTVSAKDAIASAKVDVEPLLK